MNFVDYCIATRNYSTIAAIKDYVNVKTFAEKKSGKGAKIAAAALGTAAAASGAGNVLQYLKNKELTGERDEARMEGVFKDAQLKGQQKLIDAMNKGYNRKQYDAMESYKNMTSEQQNQADELVKQGVAPEKAVEMILSGHTPVSDTEFVDERDESKKFSYYNNLINQYNSYKNRKRK